MARSRKTEAAEAVAGLIEATKRAPPGGRTARLDLPMHEDARARCTEYLIACREQQCPPSYSVLAAHLADHFDLEVAPRAIREWARKKGLA
jgi:hypothetical protein